MEADEAVLVEDEPADAGLAASASSLSASKVYVPPEPIKNSKVGWETEDTIYDDHEQEVMILKEDLEPHYDDDYGDMTYGRRLALWMSAKFGWYNPHGKARAEYLAEKAEETTEGNGNFEDEAAEAEEEKVKPPSLDAAWAYFEHITLARHFLSGGGSDRNMTASFAQRRNDKDSMQRAEPGELEEPTRLYSVWGTPEKQIGDFGIGVGLYFFTLKILTIITFVAGLINIPNLAYFSSSDYSADSQDPVKWILRGSAICSDQEWQACPTCEESDWDTFPDTNDRYASTDDGLKFILVNNCEVHFRHGLVSFISLLFVVISIYIMGLVSKKAEVEFDEAQQTSTDYSLEVENPPTDAKDPNEWKEFFEQIDDSHVTCCTVAIDSEEIKKLLVKRRTLLIKLEFMQPVGVEFDKFDLEKAVREAPPVPKWKKMLCFASDANAIRDKIAKIDEELMELSKRSYDVSNVFVTFETERAQREALTVLSIRELDKIRGNKDAIPENLLFRGEHILSVREPPEPSAVRWNDLDETVLNKMIRRCISFTLSLCCIAAGAVCIALARRRSAGTAAIVITVINVITPKVCRFINSFESHSSEGSFQASLYIKITAFRWINTAIITTIINPFTDTLTNGKKKLIHSVYAIFLAELATSPALQLSDIMGNINRHVLAPRAPDQRRMNLKFQGAHYELAERYTDMTKVLFLTVFYSDIFPSGFFFAAVTLGVHYWVDKFCLLRSWAPAPMLGTNISEFSRNYFFSLAMLVYAVLSAYNWASWPFDNACADESKVDDEYVGNHVAKDRDGNTVNVSIDKEDNNYFYCLQDMLRFKPPAFPPLASDQPEGEEWMTDGQEKILRYFGWTMIAVLCFVGLIFINRIVIQKIRNLFFSPYKPRGRASEEKFSDVDEIFGYVPQVRQPGVPFPLLVCDISGIDEGLIGWNDPYHSFEFYNVIYDVKGLVEAENENITLFDIVKHWPPEGAKSKLHREKLTNAGSFRRPLKQEEAVEEAS